MADFLIAATTGDGYDDGTWKQTGDANTANYVNSESETGVVFTNVTIPVGSVIDTATITFYGYGVNDSDTLETKIRGFDASDTPLFESDGSNKPSTREKTTASVDWDSIIPFAWGNRTTSSIVSIVQEIVSRNDWVSGNNIGFVVSRDGGTAGTYLASRDYSYDGNNVAKLTVTYSEGGTSTSTSTSTTTTSSSSSTTTTSSSSTSTTSTSSSTSSTSISTTSTSISTTTTSSSTTSTSSSSSTIMYQPTIDAMNEKITRGGEVFYY